MANKTQKLILKVLKGEIDSIAIEKKLKEIKYEIGYDTIMRNLKIMTKEGILNRVARGDISTKTLERGIGSITIV